MAAQPPDFPLNKPRVLSVEDGGVDQYIIGVLVDPTRQRTAPAWGTTLETTGLVNQGDLSLVPPNGGSTVDISDYGLVDIKPDDTGKHAVWIFRKLPGVALPGKVVVSQFGGGVLNTTKQLVPTDTTVTGGVNIVEAQVAPNADASATLHKAELPTGESWPILYEDEYIIELGVFIRIAKQVVTNTGQTGSLSGGTGGSNVVLTEYKPIDKWKTLKIVSTFPAASIGSTRVFRKPIHYPIPDEIPETPKVIKAYTMNLPSSMNQNQTSYMAAFKERLVSDSELDYTVLAGYNGPFSAEVTRTVSLTSATETEFSWIPRAERRNIAVTTGVLGAPTRGKILRLATPAAIHKAWDIEIDKIFNQIGFSVLALKADGTLDGAVSPNPFNVDTTQEGWKAQDAYLSSPSTATHATMPYYREDVLKFTALATVPNAVPRGEVIIAAVNSELWRMGLWVNDVYRIRIPLAGEVVPPVPDQVTGKYFTGPFGGTWANTNNWWGDSAHTQQATSLPGVEDDVIIQASAVGSGYSPSVKTISVEGAAVLSGIVMVAADSAAFIGTSVFAGTLTVPTATFVGSSSQAGVLNGNASFDEASNQSGDMIGSATFTGTTFNQGRITGDVTFGGSSKNRQDERIHAWGEIGYDFSGGEINGSVVMNDYSRNEWTINGNVVMNDSSENAGTINGNVEVRGSAVNSGTIDGNADVYSPAPNPIGGTVLGTVTYHGY